MSHNFKGVWITDEEFANLAPRNIFHREKDKMDIDCSEHRNRHILFRKKFNVEKTDKAIMYISADDYYKLYINGRFVAQGPSPSYHFKQNYNEIDVGAYLTEGENLIAVHTLYQGLINRVWQSGDFRHGLILDLVVDEKNLLCSLLVKQLGVNRVVSRVTKSANAQLFQKVGVDIAISAMTASLNEIKSNLCGTNIGILATVEQGKGEVLRIILSENYETIKIMDLKLPTKAIVGIIQRRNRIIIPNGTTQLMGGDNLIIFTTSENAPIIRDFFKVN